MRYNEPDMMPRTWVVATAVILLLVVISFIPPQTVGGVKLRRANILSDLLTFEDPESTTELATLDEEEFGFDQESVADCIAAVAQTPTLPMVYTCDFVSDSLATQDDEEPRRVLGTEYVLAPRGSFPATVSDTVRLSPQVISVEEFGEERMARFYDTLLHAPRPVRIAVLGDSFIEGDILTADLRERLQLVYGGGGAGFAPMASPLTAFRRTIKTQSKGWTSYNIMQRRNAPQNMRENFHISGWVCRADVGASTRWECTDYRRRLDLCNEARVYFLSPANSRVELTVNDTLRQEFSIEGGSALRQVVATAPQISSVTFRVVQGCEGFIGYGVVLDGGGVTVDNYSIRSNNGQALFWTNPSVVAQMHQMAPYDLVILQYGLNIMQQGVTVYTKYGEQIEKMVAFVHQCFEGATVLVLGVSDRSVKGSDNRFQPMSSIAAMTETQRGAAERSGAAFWSINEAMSSWGGMATFVANGWAGKDYTHINYAGGCRVAWSLADALIDGASARRKSHSVESTNRATSAGIIDSTHFETLQRELFSNPELKSLEEGLLVERPTCDTLPNQ